MWITVGTLLLSLVVYVINEPAAGRSGGSALGYTYGVIAMIAIVWLMVYGLRKRSYRSSLGTVQGWLAAHVWIGIGLLFFVPLHSAFSFGLNVHTAAYACMALTIITGIWGVANYATLSGKIQAHRGGVKDEGLIEQIDALTERIEKLCSGKSERFLALFNRFDFSFRPGVRALLRMYSIPMVEQRAVTEMLTAIPEMEREDAITMVGTLDQRADLVRVVIEQSRIKALLKLWLYFHVPISVALCVTLAIHILSVFFLW
jgi:hypothetical protein